MIVDPLKEEAFEDVGPSDAFMTTLICLCANQGLISVKKTVHLGCVVLEFHLFC